MTQTAEQVEQPGTTNAAAAARVRPTVPAAPATSLQHLLAALHCPYCGSDLAHEPAAAAAGYGVLRCACHAYPVVDGIPILRQVEHLDSVVDLVRRGETGRALVQALKLFRVTWALKSRWHKFVYRLHSRRLVARGDDLTFEDAVELVRKPKGFADYLLHRYANPSFLAAAGVMQLFGTLAGRRVPGAARHARVLDLGCGAGHSSFLIGHQFPGLSVVAADHDFVSVYLAKRFVAPDAAHLCVDAEVPSPFDDGHFDAVYCLDAFHYLRPKKAVVRELVRVASADALWLFPHLHNALQWNVTAGIPLSPDGYLRLFDLPNGRLFDEQDALTALTERHALDLSAQPPAAQLDRAATLIFAAGPDDLWRTYGGFPSLLWRDRTRLAINPIYRRRDVGDAVELTLSWPNPGMRAECAAAERILPTRYRLAKHVLRRALDADAPPDDQHLADLVGRFILVPLPPRYARGQAGAAAAA